MELAAKRDRLFAEHERGALGDGDVQTRFVALMLDAPDDALALTLCDSMPDWFREQFRAYLHDNANVGYAHRWFSMGDPRSRAQVESDAKRHGDFLERLAPEILAIL